MSTTIVTIVALFQRWDREDGVKSHAFSMHRGHSESEATDLIVAWVNAEIVHDSSALTWATVRRLIRAISPMLPEDVSSACLAFLDDPARQTPERLDALDGAFVGMFNSNVALMRQLSSVVVA